MHHRPLARILLPLLLSACQNLDTPTIPPTPPEHSAHPGPATGGAPPVPDPTSGAAFQDPSGFPDFHAWPAPDGPPIQEPGAWTDPVLLSETAGGGYRPQIVVAGGGTVHAVYYERAAAGDLLRHRHSSNGLVWSPAQPFGFDHHRNWGPDLIAASDGSLYVVFDHILPDLTSRGYLTAWRDGHWSEPEALTPADGGEVGSGHIAEHTNGDLVYAWIGRPVQGATPFQAWARWQIQGTWQAPTPLSDGTVDAWHTNVERRPDGTALVGFDLGWGGSETTLLVADGRDGAFSTPEDISATSHPGERPHFAYEAVGTDHITWFHKEASKPLHIYTRSGGPGRWGPVQEPSAGYGGYHFDPEIAVNHQGVRCLVWGWDAGQHAEMVYSIDTGKGWAAPRLLAGIGEGKPGLASLVNGDDGRFHVVWNQGVRGSNQVYYASLSVDPSAAAE